MAKKKEYHKNHLIVLEELPKGSREWSEDAWKFTISGGIVKHSDEVEGMENALTEAKKIIDKHKKAK